MANNIFTSFERVAAGEGGRALWAARAPYRPDPDFDLMLIPRLPRGTSWRQDPAAQEALDRIEAEPWVASLSRDGDQVTVRIDRRAYSPVLRQASLPADTTIPWWHGRRLHFEFS